MVTCRTPTGARAVGMVVDAVVREILEGARWSGPPVDALLLAREVLGIPVYVDRGLGNRGRAERSRGRCRIYLRPERRPERQQWTVAHELGEHWRADLLRRLGQRPADLAPRAGEWLANMFAARLLLPTDWFTADAQAVQFDLARLKARYATASFEVIARRLPDVTPCIITVIDQGRISRRCGAARGTPRGLSRLEEACRRVIQELHHPQTLHLGGWTVQGWPLHHADWQREILRTTWPGTHDG